MTPDTFFKWMTKQSDGTYELPVWQAFFSMFLPSPTVTSPKRPEACYTRIISDKIYPLDDTGKVRYEMGRPVKDLEVFYTFFAKYFDYYFLFNGTRDWDRLIFVAENELKKWKEKMKEEYEKEEYEMKVSERKRSEYAAHDIKPASELKIDPLAPTAGGSLWNNLWREQEICCLFADANIGKSILAVQIGRDVAYNKKRVLYCDYEMDEADFIRRYSDDKGNPCKFPPDFFRSQPKPDLFLRDDIHDAILSDLEIKIKENHIEAVILDNISFITPSTNSGKALTQLMYRLKHLRKQYAVSILIIAHTAKRDKRLPLEPEDLQGHKRLFDFLDSCFAIGQSAKNKDTQYIKQLKCRAAEFSYGADNVIMVSRMRINGVLQFAQEGVANEQELLPPRWTSYGDWLVEKVLELRKKDITERQIAEQLGISKTKVHRIIVSNCDAEEKQSD